MEFYKIGGSFISGEKGIKAVTPYKEYEIFKNPDLLIKNNRFVVSGGRNLYDIIRYEDLFNWAISEKLKTGLEKNNITGWSSYPIEIEGIEAAYFGFHVTGKGGRVTKFDKDGLVPMFEPIQWDQTKWDGSDIFNIDDTGIIALTAKAAEILNKFKIKNMYIESL
jgi:hypothetical protein